MDTDESKKAKRYLHHITAGIIDKGQIESTIPPGPDDHDPDPNDAKVKRRHARPVSGLHLPPEEQDRAELLCIIKLKHHVEYALGVLETSIAKDGEEKRTKYRK